MTTFPSECLRRSVVLRKQTFQLKCFLIIKACDDAKTVVLIEDKTKYPYIRYKIYPYLLATLIYINSYRTIKLNN